MRVLSLFDVAIVSGGFTPTAAQIDHANTAGMIYELSCVLGTPEEVPDGVSTSGLSCEQGAALMTGIDLWNSTGGQAGINPVAPLPAFITDMSENSNINPTDSTDINDIATSSNTDIILAGLTSANGIDPSEIDYSDFDSELDTAIDSVFDSVVDISSTLASVDYDIDNGVGC